MNYIGVSNNVVTLLTAALSNINSNSTDSARDCCNQAMALIRAIECCREELSTCGKLLVIICNRLANKNKGISRGFPHSEENEMTADINSSNPCKGGLEQVIGCDVAKSTMFENVILPLVVDPNISGNVFRGIRGTCGNVLLHGPPGTGKTLLVQAAANEAGAVFIPVSPSDVLSKYHGESERYLKTVFQRARTSESAIIFFDEFDSIASARGCQDEGAMSRRLLSELLLQLTYNKNMQRLHQGKRLIVIAATNRLEDLDEAVLRRFESKVFVGVPDAHARSLLFRHFMRETDCSLSDSEWCDVVAITQGWSGSDIEILCREAAMLPLRHAVCNRASSAVYTKEIEATKPIIKVEERTKRRCLGGGQVRTDNSLIALDYSVTAVKAFAHSLASGSVKLRHVEFNDFVVAHRTVMMDAAEETEC